MKLCVLVPAVFPTIDDVYKKLWIFLRSAEKAGVGSLIKYGTGKPFPSYRTMCLDWQLDALRELPIDYTHVLFTDAWDAFFTAPLAEIIQKYERMGSPPILCSAYIGLGNESDMSKYTGCFDETIRYRYPNRGGYIAELPAIIEAFDRMLRNTDLTGDDCMEWYRGWREGWFRPMLDSGCEIFQVTDEGCYIFGPEYEPDPPEHPEDWGRLRNCSTASNPCILHLSGGYTDPVTGKDDRMIPWALQLGVIDDALVARHRLEG